MQYKQNIHVLLPVERFEELRQLGYRLNTSRSELIRRAVNLLLERYKDRHDGQEKSERQSEYSN
jgi:metal-responsive CopG/Arc/MetJ family transcriptional regulator